MLQQPIKVLVVEDCEDDAELLRSELTGICGHLEYRRVDCDVDMRAALQDHDWDLVISDHTMPCFSSIEALSVLKESGKDIPFIIYSGNISEQIALSSLHNGVHDYVRKGNVARLIPSIKRELENAAVRRARMRAESHIRKLAYYDELTGLANRNLFFEEANRALSAKSAAGGLAAVFFINLDRFMRINHVVGFIKAGELLRQVAARLGECVGDKGILARLGGDRFAVFRGDLESHADIQLAADAIMRCFAAPLTADSVEFYITASIGISVYPGDGSDISALLINAEGAASLAKKLGGNNYKYYVREIGETASERLALEAALRKAVERDELVLHYQPMVNLATGAITGSEALVRWQHPDYGMLSPDRFIPLANEIGMIVEIGEWVLSQACRHTKRCHDKGLFPLTISVNVSAAQFGHPRLLDQVADALAGSGLDPQCLELEITESVLMQDSETTIDMLRALKKMGVKISLDDFGTGYSSLSYLSRFPIDVLKIDKSFIRGINRNGDDHAIVRAIAALAQSLNLSVVAEGIESAEQLEPLRRERCDRVQGFFFSRPLPADEFMEFLFARRRLNSDLAKRQERLAIFDDAAVMGTVH
ncbi:MAG: EAL domain-containing protein [Burkholderiales bacterium]